MRREREGIRGRGDEYKEEMKGKKREKIVEKDMIRRVGGEGEESGGEKEGWRRGGRG